MRIGNFFSRGHESSSSHGCSVANCGVSSGNIGGRHSKLTFGILFFFVTTWGSKRDPNYSYRSSLFHTLEDDKATLPAQHSPKSNARVDHWSSKFHQKTRKKWRGDHIFLQSPQWKMPDYLSLIMLVSFFLYIAEESQSREDRSWWTCRERAHRTVCTWQTWTWGEVWLLHTRNNMVVKDNRDGQPPKKYHHLLLLRWHVVMFVTLKRKGGVILFVTY